MLCLGVESRVKRISLNNEIKVRLTPLGREIYHRVYESCGAPGQYPRTDKDGFATFQMWDFMNTYGKYLEMHMPPVLEDIFIYLSPDIIEEVVSND